MLERFIEIFFLNDANKLIIGDGLSLVFSSLIASLLASSLAIISHFVIRQRELKTHQKTYVWWYRTGFSLIDEILLFCLVQTVVYLED
jgi:hypothetical protein